MNTHKNKLQNLTRNTILPFTSSGVITNLSKYHLSAEESSILKYGLSYAIPPKFISKTDIFTSFEMINIFLQSEVKSEELKAPLKAELAHLARTYYSRYRPSETAIRKHNILKKLKQNTDIIIGRPVKGNGVVILDRIIYISSMKKLLNDENKLKKLSTDSTHLREGELQRCLRQLKKSKNFLDKNTSDKIYLCGSQYARIYGLPKLHKVKDSCLLPPFRRIVSSIGI